MHTKKIGLALLFLPMALSLKTQAQKTESQTQRIIITKKNGSIDKMSIVVDGDNITINGKPASDNKDVDIAILRNSDNDLWMGLPGLEGKSFSLPFDNDDLDSNGNLSFKSRLGNKAILGVMTQVDKDGARINEVTDNSGADSAGLKKDDIITKVNETKIANPGDLSDAIGKYKPNDKVTITYLRNEKTSTTSATLHGSISRVFAWKDLDNIKGFSIPRMPNLDELKVYGFPSNKIKLGAQVQDMEDNSGVKILDTESDGALAKAGLQSNDVISKINDTNISSVDDLRNMMRKIKEGDTIQLTYLRNNKSKTVSIKFPKELKTMNL